MTERTGTEAERSVKLGVFLRRARLARGWSLRDLAKRAGVSHTQIDILEKAMDPRTGKPANVSLQTLRRVTDALEIRPEALLSLLSGAGTWVVGRPYDTWHPDEQEDYENAPPAMRPCLFARYAQADVRLPDNGGDAALKLALFGTTDGVSDEMLDAVRAYARTLLTHR